MNSIKRAYFSLKANMGRTVLQIIIFSVVFAFIVACLIIYQTADDYVKTLELSVKNAVTVTPSRVSINDNGAITSSAYGIDKEKFDELLVPDYIDGYNYSGFTYLGYSDKYKIIENSIETPYYKEYDGYLYMMVDSKTDIAFTAFGFTLVDGRHITIDDAGKKVGLISKELADMNNLKIGDTFTAHDQFEKEFFDSDITYEFEIIGLFEGPQGEFLEGYGVSPNELVMMPIDTYGVYAVKDDGTPRIPASHTRSIYFEDEAEIDKYLEYVKETFNVRKVFESRYDVSPPVIPEEAVDLEFEELVDYLFENQFVDVYIDNEWYEMVAEPIERVRDLSGFALIGFIGGAVLILVLTSANSIKKRYREFGVLLSMGESKIKIAMQVCAETLSIIVIASFIGIILGVLIGVPTVSHYTNEAYDGQAVLNQQITQNLNKGYEDNVNISGRDYHEIAVYLLYKLPTDLSVAPNIMPTYNLQVLLTFIAFSGVLTVISALIQTIYITRIKPTVLLTSRR